MKRALLIVLAGLLGFAVQGWALIDSECGIYDFRVAECDDIVSRPLWLGDTLTFDYWYKGPVHYNNVGRLSVFTWDNGIDINGALYGDGYNTLAEVDCYYESESWRNVTVDVPFYLLMNQDSTRCTDEHVLCLSTQLWGCNPWVSPVRYEDQYMCEFYVKNLQSYDTGRDIGFPDQPVPEPATMAMLGTGIMSLIGFEIRRRKTGK